MEICVNGLLLKKKRHSRRSPLKGANKIDATLESVWLFWGSLFQRDSRKWTGWHMKHLLHRAVLHVSPGFFQPWCCAGSPTAGSCFRLSCITVDYCSCWLCLKVIQLRAASLHDPFINTHSIIRINIYSWRRCFWCDCSVRSWLDVAVALHSGSRSAEFCI